MDGPTLNFPEHILFFQPKLRKIDSNKTDFFKKKCNISKTNTVRNFRKIFKFDSSWLDQSRLDYLVFSLLTLENTRATWENSIIELYKQMIAIFTVCQFQ